MTKEEKAKAYDEAFEKAKFYYRHCPSEAEKKKLEKMFPKFRESEDERIRKEIISLVKMYVSENDHCLVRGGNTTRKEALAWLEKQKTLFSSGAGLHYYYDGKATYVVGYPATAEYDLAMNQQETQKEQKPTDWSEDDERILTSIIERGSSQVPPYEAALREEQMEWLMNRLKFLRPQPKQNANDMITPDKEFFQWIYDRLVNVHKENPNVDYMISFKRRIEELSFDRPHWKPSEEQMKWLKDVIETVPMTCRQQVPLESLYVDLQKLL